MNLTSEKTRSHAAELAVNEKIMRAALGRVVSAHTAIEEGAGIQVTCPLRLRTGTREAPSALPVWPVAAVVSTPQACDVVALARACVEVLRGNPLSVLSVNRKIMMKRGQKELVESVDEGETEESDEEGGGESGEESDDSM